MHDCKIAPATYYAHRKRLTAPSARTVRDIELKERISEVFDADHRVYGARKVWRELNRQGHRVARRTVERLMRELGIAGAVRGKRVITTLPGGQVERAMQLPLSYRDRCAACDGVGCGATGADRDPDEG
ncbi:IS3 family transposase, partial [Streptomyces sp. NPDC006367]|uniref:IS3 family transposase n=1 Tax=unclassified Streptomyces TaxID=2593676 RepID=UPI0033BDD967